MSVDKFGNRLAIREDINGAAWHQLGGFVGEQTAIATLDTFTDGVPYFVKRESFYRSENGKKFIRDEDYALVRMPIKDDPKEHKVGSCGKDYNIVQPFDIATAFDEKVKRPIETLGFLSHGEKMFLTWEMPRSVIVGGTDEVKLFGTILAGFDARVAISLSTLSFRVVCRNTFNMAQNVVKYGKEGSSQKAGRIWVGRHNSPNILRDLSAWMGHIQKDAERQVSLAENFFGKLAATPVDNKNVLKSLVEAIYPDPKQVGNVPDELLGEKMKVFDKKEEKVARDRDAVLSLFAGGDSTTNGATAWDLFNNVTFYENHVRDSKKDENNSIVFGNRNKQMNDAFAVLVGYANDYAEK